MMALLAATTVPGGAAGTPATSILTRPAGAAASPAIRFGQGASATATVSARIVRGAARVGPGLPAPAARMVARQATVTAADGSAVAALIYDFE